MQWRVDKSEIFPLNNLFLYLLSPSTGKWVKIGMNTPFQIEPFVLLHIFYKYSLIKKKNKYSNDYHTLFNISVGKIEFQKNVNS